MSSFENAAPRPRIRFYPNDPLEPGLPLESPQAHPPAEDSPRFRVSFGRGTPPAPRRYATGTPKFRYWQLTEALHRGVRLWRALAPEFTLWQGGREELRAWPDAGQGLNA